MSSKKEWEALHRARDDRERRNEVQRAARIKANKILWATSRGEKVDDEVTVAQANEPAGYHQVRPPSPMEDEVFLPNTYNSAPDPLEVTTSKEAIFLPKETGVVREKIEVVADSPEVEGYVVAKVSLNCSRCPFKTARLKKRKAKRCLSTHNRNDHPLINMAYDGVANTENHQETVQRESIEILSPSTKVSLQCDRCTFRTALLKRCTAQ